MNKLDNLIPSLEKDNFIWKKIRDQCFEIKVKLMRFSRAAREINATRLSLSDRCRRSSHKAEAVVHGNGDNRYHRRKRQCAFLRESHVHGRGVRDGGPGEPNYNNHSEGSRQRAVRGSLISRFVPRNFESASPHSRP